MRNFHFEAKNEKLINKQKFFGITKIYLQDDVLTIEFNDGRHFTSHINDINKIEYVGGWKLLGQNEWLRKYVITKNNGETLKIKFDDWLGLANIKKDKMLNPGWEEPIEKCYEAIDRSLNAKPSSLEIVERVIGIAVIVVVFIVIAAL